MKYFVKSGGKTYGPAEERKIAEKIACGFFPGRCMISTDRENWSPWPTDAFEKSAEGPVLHPIFEENTVPSPSDKFDSGNTSEAQPIPPGVIRLTTSDLLTEGAAPKRGGAGRTVLFVAVIVIMLALLAAVGWLLYCRFSTSKVPAAPSVRRPAAPATGAPRRPEAAASHAGPQVASFEEVCKNYQNAVGVVVVTLEDSEGKLFTGLGKFKVDCFQPIGTAFAIAGNKFVTNCHVAYGVKDQKNGVLENVLNSHWVQVAIKHGVKTLEEYEAFKQKNKALIDKDRAFLREYVRVRSVEIRLSQSDGMRLPVTGVQIHPLYKGKISSEEEGYKNAEFDVAILTTAKNAPVYFRIADTDTLHQLAPGREIAYLGFPMSGLFNDGGLNINKPEATYKSGSVNKITDFNDVHAEAKNNRAITHSIPATGGASGSPIFLKNGEVVAVLWGVTTKAAAAQHNFAVRIDALEAVEEMPIEDISKWLGENKR